MPNDKPAEDKDRKTRRRVCDLFAPHKYDGYRNRWPIDYSYDKDTFLGLLVAKAYGDSENVNELGEPHGMTTKDVIGFYRKLAKREVPVVKVTKSFANNVKKFLNTASSGGILESSKPAQDGTKEAWYLSKEAKKYIDALDSDYRDTFNVAKSVANIRDGDVVITINIKELYRTFQEYAFDEQAWNTTLPV
jgi:hypothetical protein